MNGPAPRHLPWLALGMLSAWAAASLATAAPARPGFIETRDGRTLAGRIEPTNGAFVAVSTQLWQVALEQVDRLRLDAPAPASEAPRRGQGNGLLGCYFNSPHLAGEVVVRLDETIQFDWGTAAPIEGLSPDGFSVVWMGEVEAPASGPFTFGIATAPGDQGRLLVDGRLLCEIRPGQDPAESRGALPLEARRRYPLRFEYFHAAGNARARLTWSGPDTPEAVIPKERLFAGSFLQEHAASVRGNRGLLGTYYRNSNFTGPTFSRLDPTVDLSGAEGVPAPNFSPNFFSVRWRGQVQAPASELVTFHLASDEPARLWLGGQLLLEQPESGLAERSARVPLRRGERYDVLLEARNTGGGLAVRLCWSSPSLTKGVIPAAHLFPSRPTSADGLWPGTSLSLPAGIVLRNGTLVAGTVERADETTLRLSGLLGETPVPLVTVARIHLQEVPQTLLQGVPPKRRGVLLAKGDFLDGDFRRLEAGRVQLSSVLFGVRRLDGRREALAVFLQEVAEPPGLYEVGLRDRSALRAGQVVVTPAGLTLREPLLGELSVPWAEVVELRGP